MLCPIFKCLIKPLGQIHFFPIIIKVEIEVVCQNPGTGGTHCGGDRVNTWVEWLVAPSDTPISHPAISSQIYGHLFGNLSFCVSVTQFTLNSQWSTSCVQCGQATVWSTMDTARSLCPGWLQEREPQEKILMVENNKLLLFLIYIYCK